MRRDPDGTLWLTWDEWELRERRSGSQRGTRCAQRDARAIAGRIRPAGQRRREALAGRPR
jgi:hypothetical protein